MLDRTDLPGSCPVPAHLTTLGVSPRPATPLLRTPQYLAPHPSARQGRARAVRRSPPEPGRAGA
ncbi:hypothetical protein Ae505Ps2_1958 [Pseudonocardia sp. Ae505_Ps2]|nr:hypothetical protein Ae505Ps2_1958 [Pseudonocardia sp. Ae505_Ps2]